MQVFAFLKLALNLRCTTWEYSRSMQSIHKAISACVFLTGFKITHDWWHVIVYFGTRVRGLVTLVQRIHRSLALNSLLFTIYVTCNWPLMCPYLVVLFIITGTHYFTYYCCIYKLYCLPTRICTFGNSLLPVTKFGAFTKERDVMCVVRQSVHW